MTLTRTVSGILFQDDFNRADGAPGANYTALSGTWAIVSNKLSCTSTTADDKLEISVLGNVQNYFAQITARRASLLNYAGIQGRYFTTGYTFWFQSDTGATTDGDPNKPRTYSHFNGSYFKFAVGATGQAGIAGADALLQMSALGNPSVVRFACNGFVSTTTDSNSQTQVAGKLRLYFQSGGTTGLTGTFEDLIVCNSRTVTVTGIPAGGMIRVGGVGGVTSAAESGGTCTVVMTEQTMPAQLEVLDSGSTVLESSSGVVYGGDTFNFVAANFAALTMGGGQVVVAGTVSESGPLSAVQ